ncbi:hypothetical protein EVJ58_g179 [Rhodofomes roseus]|uniref:Uncharacterized protein n=1 Tax=Rhodofomes roseus TaxID=34475 RepID=A0A4Y9Z750_9APHY|nr:hypothetical protein EVJ58_g179 [Rhodofomes roseus]
MVASSAARPTKLDGTVTLGSATRYVATHGRIAFQAAVCRPSIEPHPADVDPYGYFTHETAPCSLRLCSAFQLAFPTGSSQPAERWTCKTLASEDPTGHDGLEALVLIQNDCDSSPYPYSVTRINRHCPVRAFSPSSPLELRCHLNLCEYDQHVLQPCAQPGTGSSKTSVESPRPRSLDLSPYGSERAQTRSSYSAESLLLFKNPEGSRSTLSLPFSYRSMHEARLRSPVAVATTSKSADTLPRPPHKARPKRREFTSYPYFVTPLAFASMNPYIMPPTPPSSPQNTKPKKTLLLPAPPDPVLAEGIPPRDTALRRVSIEATSSPAEDEVEVPTSPPTLIFKKITGSPRRLFSRPSIDELPASSTPAAPVRRHSEDRPSPTAAHHPRIDAGHGTPAGDAVPRTVTTLPSSAATERERRLHIAVTKVKLDKEVREERDVGDVLPKLRMLRAR